MTKKLVSLIALPILLSACVPKITIPTELQYMPPAAGTAGAASIVASIVDDKIPLFDSLNTYIYSIDGKRVMLTRKQWDQPILLTPGEKTLTIGFERGTYLLYGRLEIQAIPNASYQAHSKCKQNALGSYLYCDFWVVDQTTGKPVSEIVRGSYKIPRYTSRPAEDLQSATP